MTKRDNGETEAPYDSIPYNIIYFFIYFADRRRILYVYTKSIK